MLVQRLQRFPLWVPRVSWLAIGYRLSPSILGSSAHTPHRAGTSDSTHRMLT
ncbi:hypothetical protein CC78DRAFT_184458 [Lojkania enalia]|uniref:Uncharacterized protein n=1 Tax=Lojkania enalia TaxID=147567 RepID=A0A9P4KFW3_9PLEO|nr:hypothetical protein CC78DRAFT_184458 [Didymosphaeria enalia]